MKGYKQEHELMRQRLWSNAWVGVANANDCKSPDTATNYADNALEEFDKRFSAYEEKKPASLNFDQDHEEELSNTNLDT